MDAETLQRLMLDRALGALPSDCETLLDAYLASRPEAAALSRELDAAVGTIHGGLAKPLVRQTNRAAGLGAR